jgi:hypothetical protein
VGKEKIPFSIHKENLCRSSTFFNAVFSNERYLDSREALEGYLPPLSDVEPGLFRVYVHMIYTRELFSPLYFGFESYPEPKDEFKMYCELYLLADRLGDYLASTIVLENLIDNLENWPEIHWTRISKIWARTHSDSPLRAFILHWIVNSWPRDHVLEMLDEEELPDEFIREALPIALSITQPMSNDKCQEELREAILF